MALDAERRQLGPGLARTSYDVFNASFHPTPRGPVTGCTWPCRPTLPNGWH